MWGGVPEERDEARLGVEIERRRHAAHLAEAGLVLRTRERRCGGEARIHDVALAPGLRHAAHVLDETDGSDHGRRVDRTPVRLVVERHVSGDDGRADRLARGRDAVDRLRELPADLRLLGVAEVQAVREPDRLAADARDVARSLDHGERASGERVETGDPPLPVEREGQAAQRGAQANHSSIESWATNGSCADELVVAAENGPAAPQRRRRDELEKRLMGGRRPHDLARGSRRATGLPDLIARALVRQETGRDLADDVAVPERSKLAGRSHPADHGVLELPPVEDCLDRLQHLRADDCDHPLLALGDHHLPGLHLLLTEGNTVELDVDAVVGRHLGERRRNARGATVL